MNYRSATLALLFFLIFCTLSSAQQQQVKYFRQLAYNHVSPLIETRGIYEIDKSIVENTSHYAFYYDAQNRLIEIINRHYHTERRHHLTTFNAYKIKIEHQEGKEVQTYFDPNGKRCLNEKGVYKEVYHKDKNGNRIALQFLDANDKPMVSYWGITKYTWKKHKKMWVEQRYDSTLKPSMVSPYFPFAKTGIIKNKKGFPYQHINLDQANKPLNNEYGIAYYQDTYDANGNHTKYGYFNQKGELIQNQWGFAYGVKHYDSNGNYLGMSRYDSTNQLLETRMMYSNVNRKEAKPLFATDSVQIRHTALGYLEALQNLNPEQMKSVLHPDLNKVTIAYDRKTGKQIFRPTTYEDMIRFATRWNQSGAKFPFNPQNTVEILDIYDQIASVKLISDNWVEYLHLAKVNGNWKIIHLIWQYRDIGYYEINKPKAANN